MEKMRKLPLVLVSVIAATVVAVALFYFAELAPTSVALVNVLSPSSSEELVAFDCSSIPCRTLGLQQNENGAVLKRVEYELTIADMQFNHLPTVSVVANQGDEVRLTVREQDRGSYYIFAPRANLAHEFSAMTPTLIVDTSGLEGNYDVLLQGSLDPASARTNFQAAVLRVQ